MTEQRPSGSEATIPTESLNEARRLASDSGRSVVETLEALLDLDRSAFLSRLGRTLLMPVVDMNSLRAISPAFDLLPFTEAARCKCIVYRQGDGNAAVIADPFDLQRQIALESRLGALDWQLAHGEDIAAALAVREGELRAIDGVLAAEESAMATATQVDDLSLASIADDVSPVVRLVNSAIYDALKLGVSDIHLETQNGGLQVKYRIDGVLSPITSVPGLDTAEQVVSRIKVMAELDIAEKRIPQDGRFKLSVRGHEVDYRVSVMPSIFGEDVVIRILDKQSLSDQFHGLRLDILGFDGRTLEDIRALAREPYGMFLVTGPTGSGKTTTLYAAISEINDGKDKIITIEDPVEYQLPGILQIPVNERKGLGFARGLRSILRHDPDKILVGEIRDPETAQIAIQSALTGHLVFTSVHANNVFDVIGRFMHMQVDPYSFVSALNGILAQRLIRLVCPECSISVRPSDLQLGRSGIDVAAVASMNFQRGRGCGHCRGTGYKGRHAIGEVLRMTDELREMIVGRAPIRSIKQVAREHGTRLLREAAVELVAQGRTTLDEINRVTFVA